MVRRVQVRGNHELMFSDKCERYVFKTVGMVSNLLKKLCFASNLRPKEPNQSRVAHGSFNTHIQLTDEHTMLLKNTQQTLQP